ncbi:PLAC8 motif-containing protein [Dillenia turbinata]|uniref:PLAC8 motif-containing protein n=1 Tax=Dillenia turbinata TaxID=194707 RepID=A0AAN8Z7R1_9MAGN
MARPDTNPSSLPNPPQQQQTESDPQPGQNASPVNTTQPVQFPPPGSYEYEFRQSEQFPPPIQQPNHVNFTHSEQVLQGYPVNLPPNPSYPSAPPPPTMQIPTNYHTATNVHTYGPQMQYAPTYANATANAYPQQVQPPPVLVNNTAQVIMVQPPPPVYGYVAPELWTTGLLDCFDDPLNALITLWFPCVTFGQVAEIVDSGHTSCGVSALLYAAILAFIGCPCIISCSYRTKLRSKFNLVESPASDWIIHTFCDYCALCQEYRELRNRGFDPAIGWNGNMARFHNQQQMQVGMVPPTNQTMMGR